MKKILQLAAAGALMFTAVESKGQITNGNLSPNWTFTDIAGTTQDLYTILNSGKTVILDISAAWCSPCWAYHNSGNLDSVWYQHGPAGAPHVYSTTTNDVVVFLVEGELTNTSAQLTGTSTGSTYATFSQGDWTLNTHYPIIDLSSATTGANAFLSGYNLHYFPTMIMICPDRSMTEVDQWSFTALYNQKVSGCTAATVAVDAEMITSTALNSLASCDSVTPTFRMGNVGTSTLTSATITYKVDGVTQKVFNWTGSLATYANTTITGVKVGAATPGSHTVTAVISNANGGSDPTGNNSTGVSFNIYPAVGGSMVSESFESAGIPSTFTLTNGASGSYWDNATVGYSSSASAYLAFYGITAGDIEYMELPPMSFASSTSPTLTFDVAHAQYASENDKLEVQVSTNCGASWISRYSKAGATLATAPVDGSSEFSPSGATQWRHETVNLSTYAGMSSVIVRFKGTSDYGNDLYVDNINFTPAAGINENTAVNNVSVYPNPMTNNATVNFELVDANNVSIVVVNTIGQVVKSENLGKMAAGQQMYSLDASSLSNGLYFLNITVGNSTVSKKVSINK